MAKRCPILPRGRSGDRCPIEVLTSAQVLCNVYSSRHKGQSQCVSRTWYVTSPDQWWYSFIAAQRHSLSAHYDWQVNGWRSGSKVNLVIMQQFLFNIKLMVIPPKRICLICLFTEFAFYFLLPRLCASFQSFAFDTLLPTTRFLKNLNIFNVTCCGSCIVPLPYIFHIFLSMLICNLVLIQYFLFFFMQRKHSNKQSTQRRDCCPDCRQTRAIL